LVSDAGIRGLVILNKARQIEFEPGDPAQASTRRVQAESGVILPTLARQCIERGLMGLEWSIGVPGRPVRRAWWGMRVRTAAI
jgi:UDP-N-acetylenolpyruvoylglucosamine reductase